MIRKHHNHKPQTTPWHCEEEPLKLILSVVQNTSVDELFYRLRSNTTWVFCLWFITGLLTNYFIGWGAPIQWYFVCGVLYDYWGALLQVKVHHYKDKLSVMYNRAIEVRSKWLKSTTTKDIMSVVYNRAIEKLFYRTKSTSTRQFCLWCIANILWNFLYRLKDTTSWIFCLWYIIGLLRSSFTCRGSTYTTAIFCLCCIKRDWGTL